MKKVIIRNHKNLLVEPNWTWYIKDESEITYNETWGSPERWVLQNSEHYEDSDVIQTEERIDPISNESTTWVLLRADYTIEIEDITDQLNKQNRITELKKLLVDSDFRMTTDYYKRMTPEKQTYWDTTRESWRSELRELLGE